MMRAARKFFSDSIGNWSISSFISYHIPVSIMHMTTISGEHVRVYISNSRIFCRILIELSESCSRKRVMMH